MSELKDKDRPIDTELFRAGVGLRITLRTHPIIEEFFQGCQGLPEPQVDPVDTYGRNWEPARGESRKDLMVYQIPRELTGEFRTGSVSYRLDRPGQPLFLGGGLEGAAPAPRGGGLGGALNLSFLRLRGSSDPSGISFYIAGVFSDESVDTLERAIGEASQEIYRQFMKPIKVNIVLEVRGNDESTRMIEVPVINNGMAA